MASSWEVALALLFDAADRISQLRAAGALHGGATSARLRFAHTGTLYLCHGAPPPDTTWTRALFAVVRPILRLAATADERDLLDGVLDDPDTGEALEVASDALVVRHPELDPVMPTVVRALLEDAPPAKPRSRAMLRGAARRGGGAEAVDDRPRSCVIPIVGGPPAGSPRADRAGSPTGAARPREFLTCGVVGAAAALPSRQTGTRSRRHHLCSRYPMRARLPASPWRLAATVTILLLVRSTIAGAAPLPAPSTVAAPAVADSQPSAAGPELAPAPPPQVDRDEHMERARFSAGRLVVEILAGAAVGSLAAYGTFSSLCDGGSDCLGAGLAGFTVNFAITPLAVWGVGRWMGGQGTLGTTYLGASLALGPFGATGPADEAPSDTIARINLEFAISTLLLPVTTALCFELTSHMSYSRWRAAAQSQNLSAGIMPTYDRRGVDGAIGQISLRF